jgi:hypothetical protein
MSNRFAPAVETESDLKLSSFPSAVTKACATIIYQQVNIPTAREFQRLRESDAYSSTDLGFEEERIID